MHDLYIAATATSPEVDFCFSQHRFRLRGESYPENAAAFYGPVLLALSQYLAMPDPAPLSMQVDLTYLNSSSTKLVFNLLQQLHAAALGGSPIMVQWLHDADDDSTRDFGLELAEDFPAIEFTVSEHDLA